MKIIKIGSLFYGIIIMEDDAGIRIVSEGFPTREMAESVLAIDEIYS